MNVSDFAFELPDELIAQEAAPRGTSRLLVLDRVTGGRRHASIADLPAILRSGDLLVVNNTRVFAARLLGRRVPSGGAVECLLLSPPRPLPASAPRFPKQTSRFPLPAPRFPNQTSRFPDPGSRTPDPVWRKP